VKNEILFPCARIDILDNCSGCVLLSEGSKTAKTGAPGGLYVALAGK
jgi:hypothetical protein